MSAIFYPIYLAIYMCTWSSYVWSATIVISGYKYMRHWHRNISCSWINIWHIALVCSCFNSMLIGYYVCILNCNVDIVCLRYSVRCFWQLICEYIKAFFYNNDSCNVCCLNARIQLYSMFLIVKNSFLNSIEHKSVFSNV